MAKKRFISGNLKIEVAFNDRSNNYQVKLCPSDRVAPSSWRPEWRRQALKCERVKVGSPAHITRGVDSPASMREAARAAISFASNSIQEKAATDAAGSDWVVRTPRNIRGPRRRRR